MSEQKDDCQIRKAVRQDSRRVWEIRNHPQNRVNFNHPEAISFEQHDAWFEQKYFSRNDNYCFILTDENNGVIGYCRFDREDEKKTYIISIALNPDNHGKGLGSKLLSESLQVFKGKHPILAEIKKQNIPSIKLFQKNNFQIYKEDEKNFYLIFKLLDCKALFTIQ